MTFDEANANYKAACRKHEKAVKAAAKADDKVTAALNEVNAAKAVLRDALKDDEAA